MKKTGTIIVSLDFALKGLRDLLKENKSNPETRKSLLLIMQMLVTIRYSLVTVAQTQAVSNRNVVTKEILEIAAVLLPLLAAFLRIIMG